MNEAGNDVTTLPPGGAPKELKRHISNAPAPMTPVGSSRGYVVARPKPSISFVPAPSQGLGMGAHEAAATDSLPVVPLDWMPLKDLPRAIAARCGVSVDTVAAEVVDAVWTGELRKSHCIAGINQRPYEPRLPPGLRYNRTWNDADWIVAVDWNHAEVDQRNGTVGGWPREGGTRERLPIGVLWTAAKNFADLRAQRWRKQEAAGAQPPPLPGRGVTTTRKSVPRETICKWVAAYVEEIPPGQKVNRDQFISQCQKGTGCTRPAARDAYRDHLPEERKKGRGQPKRR